ncbi:MAG TPA: YciI family protein [Nitrospirota bacterium]|nr:YciI family protein [Nitrospirota bacterium]
MFVILVNYIKPLSEIDALLEDHRRFLDEGYAAGFLLASGPRIPRTGGVILAHATSAEELKAYIAKDPFYRAGVATYEVVEFTAVKFDPRLQQIDE